MGKTEERTKVMAVSDSWAGDERCRSQQLLIESIANTECSAVSQAELLASLVSTLNQLNILCALVEYERDPLEPQKPILRADDRLN